MLMKLKKYVNLNFEASRDVTNFMISEREKMSFKKKNREKEWLLNEPWIERVKNI